VLLLNRHRIARRKLELEKQGAENELQAAAERLENFRVRVREKTELIEQFESELDRYRSVEKQDDEDGALLQLHQSTILTDEQWEEFRVLFEKVHKGFFRRVKEQMPDLTFTEVRFLALSRLKLSPREMASMLGVSPGSIRNYRLRLRRKLGLDDEASIEELAERI
jgi:DNA-binding CsgD family transcriptional regulator